MILTYTAQEKDRGRTVYSIVRHEMHISAALNRRMKAVHAISVSGVAVYSNFIISPGDIVTADVSAAEPLCDNIPEDGFLDVLFENEGLIAVNKPSGTIVHPSRSKNSGTLANFVAHYITSAGGVPSCHAVNRLDRDTTGIVLFAKNSHMKARASSALSDESSIKEYVALVHGAMPYEGVIDLPVQRLSDGNMMRFVSPDGQRAVTHYKTSDVFRIGEDSVSLVQLRLETGRTHQIRVHCLHLGHHVLGDTLYSTEDSRRVSLTLGITSQALHARKLGFVEPLSGTFVEITAPLPAIFSDKLI